MTKPQLVLDIGGVLVTNLSPLFWQLLAAESHVSEEALYTEYKKELSEALWTGAISEEQFWAWVKERAPQLQMDRAPSMIDRCLQPLPAMEMLQEWSTLADIHLLSNHLPSWVEPIVKPNRKYWRSVTISSTTGFRKPHPEIYANVIPHLPEDSTILFVDDQDKNLRQAAMLGWHTLLADDAGVWISKVTPLLLETSRQEQNQAAKRSNED
ncbi:haloacid dehalogenase [Paenibacillus sp. sgz302251]|uniref:haloacid dehalogenase n=1 Tax=Paenibacillus sp. sgz302251 TaxID=3414493 RepID=UPI003C7A68CF